MHHKVIRQSSYSSNIGTKAKNEWNDGLINDMEPKNKVTKLAIVYMQNCVSWTKPIAKVLDKADYEVEIENSKTFKVLKSHSNQLRSRYVFEYFYLSSKPTSIDSKQSGGTSILYDRWMSSKTARFNN